MRIGGWTESGSVYFTIVQFFYTQSILLVCSLIDHVCMPQAQLRWPSPPGAQAATFGCHVELHK